MILATLSLCVFASLPQDPLLKPADQQKIASKLADYVDAKIAEDVKKEAKNYEAFEKEFDRLGKKLNKGQGLLSSPIDIDEILQAAGSWVKSEGGPGKVSTGKSIGPSWISWAHWAPKSYDPKIGNYPVVLWIVPNGTNARNFVNDASSNSPLAETHILVATTLPKAEEGDATAAAMLTLNGALSTFRADHNRVFLAAEGETCGLVLSLANRFPQRFAGVILLAPAGKPSECLNLSGISVYLGGNAEPWQTALQAAKAKVTTGETAPANLAEWVPNQQRDPYPVEITFHPPHRSAKQSYWVRLEPDWTIGTDNQIDLDPEKRPNIVVKVDREKNRITADVKRVSRIEFLLNDKLVDLENPITIEVNGKVTEIKKERDMKFMLEQFLRSGDRGSSFCASVLINDIQSTESEKPADGDKKDDTGKQDEAANK